MYKSDFSVGTGRDQTNPFSMTFDERERDLKKVEEQKAEIKKREGSSPYKRFAQYNLEQTAALMWLTKYHPNAMLILFFITDQMDKKNALSCTNGVIAEAVGVSKITVIRNVQVLKDNGFIKVLKNGTANVYHVNSKLYWKNKGSNLWQAAFSANMVLSLKEQDKDVQESIMHSTRIDIPGTGESFLLDESTGELL